MRGTSSLLGEDILVSTIAMAKIEVNSTRAVADNV